MLGFCPISGRPIAGELLAPRETARPWPGGASEYSALLAALATHQAAARASSIAAARAAEEAQEDAEPQADPPASDTYPARPPAMICFGFCPCCCHYTSDRFSQQPVSSQKWSDTDGWGVVDGKLQTSQSDAKLLHRVVHPDDSHDYNIRVRLCGSEPGDRLRVHWSDDAFYAEFEFGGGEDQYDGYVRLYSADVLIGSVATDLLQAGTEIRARVCARDGDEGHDPGSTIYLDAGGETGEVILLYAAGEITSSQVALGTGTLTGTASFDDFRVERSGVDRAGCAECQETCDWLSDSFRRAALEPEWEGDGMLADGVLTLAEGSTLSHVVHNPEPGGRYNLAVTVRYHDGGDCLRIGWNDWANWIEYEAGTGANNGRVRIGKGETVVSSKSAIGISTAGDITITLCVGENEDGVYVASNIKTDVIAFAAGGETLQLKSVKGDIEVKSVAVSRHHEDNPDCEQCLPETVFGGCSRFLDSFDRGNGSLLGSDWEECPAGWSMGASGLATNGAGAVGCKFTLLDDVLPHTCMARVVLASTGDEARVCCNYVDQDSHVYMRAKKTGEGQIEVAFGRRTGGTDDEGDPLTASYFSYVNLYLAASGDRVCGSYFREGDSAAHYLGQRQAAAGPARMGLAATAGTPTFAFVRFGVYDWSAAPAEGDEGIINWSECRCANYCAACIDLNAPDRYALSCDTACGTLTMDVIGEFQYGVSSEGWYGTENYPPSGSPWEAAEWWFTQEPAVGGGYDLKCVVSLHGSGKKSSHWTFCKTVAERRDCWETVELDYVSVSKPEGDPVVCDLSSAKITVEAVA